MCRPPLGQLTVILLMGFFSANSSVLRMAAIGWVLEDLAPFLVPREALFLEIVAVTRTAVRKDSAAPVVSSDNLGTRIGTEGSG